MYLSICTQLLSADSNTASLVTAVTVAAAAVPPPAAGGRRAAPASVSAAVKKKVSSAAAVRDPRELQQKGVKLDFSSVSQFLSFTFKPGTCRRTRCVGEDRFCTGTPEKTTVSDAGGEFNTSNGALL